MSEKEHDTEEVNGEELEEKKEKKKEKKILQYERIRTSFERLQLAWIRSSLTTMVIGIGTYEFYIGRIESGRRTLSYVSGKEVGLFLLALSGLMLVFSLMQHIKSMNRLKRYYLQMRLSIATVLSIVLILFSIILFYIFLFRATAAITN